MTKSPALNPAATDAGAKKTWIRPRADSTPARSAEITGGGTGDGFSCHS